MTDLADRAAAEERARRRHLSVTVAACALAVAAYVAVVLYAAGRLPETMATHFGASGLADSFTPTPLAILMQGAAVIGTPLVLLAVFAAGGWWRGEHARAFSALIVGVSAGLLALFVDVTLAHVGVSDPAEVRLTGMTALVSLGAVALAALLAYLALPPPLPRPPAQPVTPIVVAPGERVSWFGQAHTPPGVMFVLSGVVVAVVVAAISTGTWWVLLLGALLVLLLLGILSFSVTVDARGVAWRGALGFPRGNVPLHAIQQATVVEVSPGDFGGMGLRYLPGRLGLITRSGRALRVEHERGALVITLDDPDTAASVIEGLRAAAR